MESGEHWRDSLTSRVLPALGSRARPPKFPLQRCGAAGFVATPLARALQVCMVYYYYWFSVAFFGHANHGIILLPCNTAEELFFALRVSCKRCKSRVPI